MSIIEVKNIGKKYNINHQQGRYITLRDVLANVFSNPFSFFKKKFKDITSLNKKEEFWALKDINFNVEKGEVIGIIGRNGAGKSTLLKILSQITPPTTGEIKINGRVGSLLEVGTGFHPELTGRENIFLNGAILGMKKGEIVKKFDDIVEFAGIEKFLDTPVKYYSSGMYVRLAFSVAAHMEPDVLIIDEVLAVGDADFQKKCLGKMDEITKKEGRTILFVSHNMAAIKQLCVRCVLLEDGSVKKIGAIDDVINEYLSISSRKGIVSEDGFINIDQNRNKVYLAKVFDKVRILDDNNKPCDTFPFFSSMKIEVKLKNTESFPDADYGILIMNSFGQRITSFATWMTKTKKNNPQKILLEIPEIKFSSGNYYIYLSMTNSKEGTYIDRIDNAVSFSVVSTDIFNTGRDFSEDYGLVLPEGNFILS